MKILFSLLVLFCIGSTASLSQERLGSGVQGAYGVLSASTAWTKAYVGPAGRAKDVNVINYDTDTDTVKVTFWRGDTSSGTREWRIAGQQSVTFYSMTTDTIWYKSTGTSPVDIRAIKR